MRCNLSLLLLAVLLSGCKMEADDTPVGAARMLIQATKRHNCTRAFSIFTRERQDAIRAEFSRRPPRGIKTAEELYCLPGAHNPYGSMDPTTAHLASHDANNPTVRVTGQDEAGGSITWQVLMEKESGHWRVKTVNQEN